MTQKFETLGNADLAYRVPRCNLLCSRYEAQSRLATPALGLVPINFPEDFAYPASSCRSRYRILDGIPMYLRILLSTVYSCLAVACASR